MQERKVAIGLDLQHSRFEVNDQFDARPRPPRKGNVATPIKIIAKRFAHQLPGSMPEAILLKDATG